ncbi:ATP-binding cassette domain-containing protein [Enterococcus durans]|uniref:ATP-binding cassette domain-containing protein n=1 Tax=Enterococcus durans TaxID=53345 RepID=UPI0018845968|nr:ATP-binding cassette domain-containing protein [Enterococcus durans]
MIGPNGVGKTTLLKCICDLLVPDNDEIKIDDLVLNRSTHTIFLRHIGSGFI